VKHKPSCSLCNADSTAKLVATDSVFAICDCPNGYEPFIKSKRAILKDSPYLRAKLPSAILAPHKVTGLNLANSHTATMNAHGGIASPADFPHILFANFQIRKVADGSKQGFWKIHNLLLLSPFAGMLILFVTLGTYYPFSISQFSKAFVTPIDGASSAILVFFSRFIKLFVSPYNRVGYKGTNFA
jgi:hypothetical protein